jgi:hypothetical protein
LARLRAKTVVDLGGEKVLNLREIPPLIESLVDAIAPRDFSNSVGEYADPFVNLVHFATSLSYRRGTAIWRKVGRPDENTLSVTQAHVIGRLKVGIVY